MTTETVYSPIRDEKMNSHLNDSEVWKNAYHQDELTDEVHNKHNLWFKYTIKFNGLCPIQVTKFEAI